MGDTQLELYGRAIAENFPELAIHEIEHLAHGKDHQTCLVNGELVFRFPKRAEAERKLMMEINLLPELAPTLPLPVPNYSYVGSAAPKLFPHVFVGYQMLAGEPLTRFMPHIWDEGWWPSVVGGFLTALHHFPVERAIELGVSGGTAYQWRNRYEVLYAGVQERVSPLVTGVQRAAISRFFGGFLNNPSHFTFQPVLLHGDLYSQHILLDNARQKVTGIIDFSECVIGDPAFDIRNAWEPYYTERQGYDAEDQSWRERRDFYYRLQPLLELALSDGTAGLEDVNPRVRAHALAQIDQMWPPDGAV